MLPSGMVNNNHVSHADLFRSGVGVIKFWEHEGLEPKLLGSRPSWTVSTHGPHSSGPYSKPDIVDVDEHPKEHPHPQNRP